MKARAEQHRDMAPDKTADEGDKEQVRNQPGQISAAHFAPAIACLVTPAA
jgi:hypothetical protein